jgi:hypothetical protein
MTAPQGGDHRQTTGRLIEGLVSLVPVGSSYNSSDIQEMGKPLARFKGCGKTSKAYA